MLNSEQCIEIAEKIWGWSRQKIDNFPKTVDGYWPLDPCMWQYLQKEVLSWSGFGRTVEAMAGRGWKLDGWKPDDDYTLAFVPVYRTKGDIVCLKYNPDPYPYQERLVQPEVLIPATHLAALEAVK